MKTPKDEECPRTLLHLGTKSLNQQIVNSATLFAIILVKHMKYFREHFSELIFS